MTTTKPPLASQGGKQQELEVLTVAEACKWLRISAWSFYQLVNRRKIRTVKIGRRRLVTRATLEQLIDDLSGGDV